MSFHISTTRLNTIYRQEEYPHPYVLSPLLRDLTQISMHSWGSAILAHLYRELCQASLDGATDIVGCVTLLQI